MQSEWIFNALINWMEKNDYPAEAIQAFANRWRQLYPHNRLPCPKCLSEGEEQLLAPHNAVDKFELLVCPGCHTKYHIPKISNIQKIRQGLALIE